MLISLLVRLVGPAGIDPLVAENDFDLDEEVPWTGWGLTPAFVVVPTPPGAAPAGG